MKLNLLKFAAVSLCVLFFINSADAQKRRQTTRKTRTTPASSVTATNALDIRSGAEKVSTQIKNVSKFIFVLGGVARVIEDLDRDIQAGKASRNARDLNQRNKQTVITTIKNLQAGLAALEIDFRTKNGLKPYVFQIQGISDMTGLAEDQASAGQFTEAGKTLLNVVEKLSDTLAALP